MAKKKQIDEAKREQLRKEIRARVPHIPADVLERAVDQVLAKRGG